MTEPVLPSDLVGQMDDVAVDVPPVGGVALGSDGRVELVKGIPGGMDSNMQGNLIIVTVVTTGCLLIYFLIGLSQIGMCYQRYPAR